LRQESLERLAARQYGLVTHAQALAAGVTDRQISGRVRSGRWRRLYRAVFVVAGAPATRHQSLLAAVLACGDEAVASHGGAAWLWGLADEPTLDVTVPRRCGPRTAGVRVHRRDGVRRVVRQGVPATTPLRTLLDLDAALLDDAVDRGVASRLFTVAGLEAQLNRVGRSGRAGVGPLREALARRVAHESRPASVLESRMGRLLRAAGLPPPVPEYAVGRYRLDFAWPELRLAVEVDGYRRHSSWDAFRDDRSRQNDLIAAGWVVLHFTWDDVCNRPEEVAAQIASVLFSLRAG
jgi:hypothetical protein